MRKEVKDKVVVGIMIVACLITLGCCFAHSYYTQNFDKTHYKTIASVYEVNSTETLFIDPCGDVWSVDKMDNVEKGDMVEITFYNHCTDYTHEDDIIVNVKKVEED